MNDKFKTINLSERSLITLDQGILDHVREKDVEGWDLVSHTIVMESVHSPQQFFRASLVFRKQECVGLATGLDSGIEKEEWDIWDDNAKLKYVLLLEKLLAERNRLLEAIPGCPSHGRQCVPHALAWVEKHK